MAKGLVPVRGKPGPTHSGHWSAFLTCFPVFPWVQTIFRFQVPDFSACPNRLVGKVLFVVPLINSVITFMEANLWQNVKHAERKLLHRGRNGLWQAEPTKQERKPN